MIIINMIRGFCMALADSVPGVSGGSVAFLMGFYEEFITSLNDIVSGNKEEKRKAGKFLIKLLGGWVIGMAIATTILSSMFEKQIYQVSSLFLGFIIVAIIIIAKEYKIWETFNSKNLIALIIGAVFVVGVSLMNGKIVNGFDITQFSVGGAVYLFIVGMLAISAMVLPGISGSTLLLAFGVYLPIINGVKDFFHLNMSSFPSLLVFGIGVLCGIIFVIKWIKLAFEKQPHTTVYAIVGLMAGSIYSIIVGPTTLKTPQAALSLDKFSILFFIIGIVLVFALDFFSKIKAE